jgi:predicted DNA-binding transcriptional regulator YafY
MATARLERTLRLLSLVQSGSPDSARGLAKTLGCCPRTVHRDIGLLRRSGVEIRFDPARLRYIATSSFDTPETSLADRDLAALIIAASEHVLAQDDKLSVAVSEAMIRLAETAPCGLRQRIDAMLNEPDVQSSLNGRRGPLMELLDKLRENRNDSNGPIAKNDPHNENRNFVGAETGEAGIADSSS